jgi:hypothetical protein
MIRVPTPKHGRKHDVTNKVIDSCEKHRYRPRRLSGWVRLGGRLQLLEEGRLPAPFILLYQATPPDPKPPESAQPPSGNLNRYLLILKRLIFESSVRAGSPSFLAAPDRPEIRP